MIKKMKLLIIIIAIAVISVLCFLVFLKKCPEYVNPKTGHMAGGCFFFWQKGYWSGEYLFKDDNVGAVGTKTFSEISGFTFEYPVFNGWEVKEINKVSENEYYIKFNVPRDVELYMPPQLNIKKINESSKQTDNLWIKKNVNGVWYSELSGLMGYGFFSNDFRVIITLVSGGVEEKGFSNLVALNKIIDSFKFNQ